MANAAEWSSLPDGTALRTLTDIVIVEVSLVARPAYPTASAAIASGPSVGRAAAPARPAAPVIDMAEAERQLRFREHRMHWNRLMDQRLRLAEMDAEGYR